MQTHASSRLVRLRPLTLLLLPLLTALAVYWPALDFGKVWDDWALLGEFGYYRDPQYWGLVLSLPLPFSDNYFRPLVVFTFLLEGWAGASDFHSHLINILIHGANSVLVAIAALKLWPERDAPYRHAVALGTALLYAAHQIMPEGVVWLVGRFDLLTTTFFLLAILADACIKGPWLRTVATSLAFLAALFCKEMAVTLPVTLLLLHAARSPDFKLRTIFSNERIALYVSLTVTLAICLAVRQAAMGYVLTEELGIAYLDLGSPLQRLLLTGKAYAGYLNVMLIPASVSPLHYSALPVPLNDLAGWLGLVLLALTVGLAVFLARRPATRFTGLCLLAMLVALLPVLHLKPVPMLLGNTYFADRAAMTPLVFLLLGLGHQVARLSLRPQVWMVAAGVLVWIALSVQIIRLALPVWQYDLNLWTYLSSENPDCSHCRSARARLLIYAESPAAGLAEADIALAKAPQRWQAAMASNVRAGALKKMGRIDEALAAVVFSEQIEPLERGKVHYMFSHLDILIAAKRIPEATALFERIMKFDHRSDTGIVQRLGDLAVVLGRPDLAREYYEKVLVYGLPSQRPLLMGKTNNPDDWRRVGDMFARQKNTREAEAAYKEAERLSRLAPVQPAP